MANDNEFDNVGLDDPGTTDESGGQEEKVKVGDKEYSLVELNELISKGEDYTKKTMELSESRKTIEQRQKDLEQFDELRTEFEKDPQRVIEHLTKAAGVQTRNDDGTFAKKEIDLSNILDPDVRNAIEQSMGENYHLKKMVKDMSSNFERMQSVVQEVLSDREAQVAAREIRQEYGGETDALELRALMGKHGTQNPKTAWRAEYFDKAKDSSLKAGAALSSQKTPQTPKDESRRVIPKSEWDGKKWSTDRMRNAMLQGYELEGMNDIMNAPNAFS